MLAVLLTLVVPGGALRDAVRPRAQAAVAFAGGAVPVPPGAMAGTWPAARAHLCGLASQFRHGDRRAVGAGGRRRVPVPEGRLELRRGNSPRTRPLSMAEEQTEAVKAEVPELNTKLWDAAEAGDAELIRKLVEDGAEVNSAPFVPDEDDDDGDSFSSMPVSELSEEIIASNQASEIDYSSVTADGKIEKPKAHYSCVSRVVECVCVLPPCVCACARAHAAWCCTSKCERGRICCCASAGMPLQTCMRAASMRLARSPFQASSTAHFSETRIGLFIGLFIGFFIGLFIRPIQPHHLITSRHVACAGEGIPKTLF